MIISLHYIKFLPVLSSPFCREVIVKKAVLIMYLIPFDHLFPEIAHKETRSLTLNGLGEFPNSDYGLLESYCPDPNCDCQRVMLNIVSRREQKQVATISYGFDRSAEDAGPYLDPFNPQSPYAEPLMKVIAGHLETYRAYVLRLKAHYALVKAAVANPNHPAHQKLAAWRVEEQKLLEKDERVVDLSEALRVISEHEPAFRGLERKTGQKRRRRASSAKKTGKKPAGGTA